MGNIRTKGPQLPWGEVNEFEDEEFNGFVAISNKNGQNTLGFGKEKLEIKK